MASATTTKVRMLEGEEAGLRSCQPEIYHIPKIPHGGSMPDPCIHGSAKPLSYQFAILPKLLAAVVRRIRAWCQNPLEKPWLPCCPRGQLNKASRRIRQTHNHQAAILFCAYLECDLFAIQRLAREKQIHIRTTPYVTSPNMSMWMSDSQSTRKICRFSSLPPMTPIVVSQAAQPTMSNGC